MTTEELLNAYKAELAKPLDRYGFAQGGLFNKAYIQTLVGRMDEGMISWSYHQFINHKISMLLQELRMQPAPICQNCGTPAQVGWHEVRTAVDSVVCHTDADGSQEIEY